MAAERDQAGPAGSGLSGGGTATSTGSRLGGQGLESTLGQVEGRADELMDQAADQLENVAGRLDDLAEKIPDRGMGARAGGLAAGAADTLESVARFLRDNDAETLQVELGRILRQRPVGLVLLALGAGFVAGKVLR